MVVNPGRQENDSQETKQQKWDKFKLFCNRKQLHSAQVTKFITLNAVVFTCFIFKLKPLAVQFDQENAKAFDKFNSTSIDPKRTSTKEEIVIKVY